MAGCTGLARRSLDLVPRSAPSCDGDHGGVFEVVRLERLGFLVSETPARRTLIARKALFLLTSVVICWPSITSSCSSGPASAAAGDGPNAAPTARLSLAFSGRQGSRLKALFLSSISPPLGRRDARRSQPVAVGLRIVSVDGDLAFRFVDGAVIVGPGELEDTALHRSSH